MNSSRTKLPILIAATLCSAAASLQAIERTDVGVGAKPIEGAEVIIDGSREMLDEKWTYWEGPRFGSSLPIKWKIVEDPVDEGTVVMTDDPAAAGGKYGAADIVTKKKYRDFRLHIEFLIIEARAATAASICRTATRSRCSTATRPSTAWARSSTRPSRPTTPTTGVGKWNAYDIVFRAARFEDGKLTEKAMVTMYFNGKKVHEQRQPINQVWGGANSGIDGGNDGGKGITDTPGGLKLQCEGHDVRYRNIWIKELDLKDGETDF